MKSNLFFFMFWRGKRKPLSFEARATNDQITNWLHFMSRMNYTVSVARLD